MNRNKLWLSLLIFLPNLYVIAQDFDTVKQYNWFDTTIGIENTGLYNGVEYIDVEKATGEFEKFLYNNGFQFGSIGYDGQTYYDIRLKYDVFNDEVILQLAGDNGTTILQPFKELINSFHITNRSFKKIVNKTTENDNDELSGFYEALLKTPQLTVLKKHRKKRLKRIKRKKLNYQFKPKKPDYFLYYQNKYYSVKNKRDFIQLFPEFKNEINSIGIDGSVKRDNPDAVILAYAKQINTLLSKQ